MNRIELARGDITKLAVDAVVNAANSRLAGGGGVDGAIHEAGGPSILEECRAWVSEHGELATGEAMLTGAGEMPAKYVIHTVGPVWSQHAESAARRLLASCYTRSLDLAAASRCRSVAFPNISTGVYGFPKQAAAETAVDAVRGWEDGTVEEVVFVCFDDENFAIYSGLLEG
jgi:O-acetyl-ADP-ribose deacetylase (regulator of RNase III)